MASIVLAASQGVASLPVGQVSCPLFDAQGRPISVLTISMRATTVEGSETGRHPLVNIRSSNPAYPDVENMPVSEQQLTSGTWEVVSRRGGPGNVPDAATARTGYRLALWTRERPVHGYAILMADGPGSHFEIAGYRSVAAGLCATSSAGEQQ